MSYPFEVQSSAWCMCCGNFLDKHRKTLLLEKQLPPSCERCESMVVSDVVLESPHWPTGWTGGAYLTPDGKWRFPTDIFHNWTCSRAPHLL